MGDKLESKLGVFLERIDFTASKKATKEILQKYNEKLVLISDDHYTEGDKTYMLGTLKIDLKDDECYNLQLRNNRAPNDSQLHYHDLISIIVPLSKTF